MASDVILDRLRDMADVADIAPADGYGLKWIAATELWTPAPVASPVGVVTCYDVRNPPAGFAAAVGDGAWDDQPALQALVNALLPPAYGGTLPPGMIFFPPGIYKLGSTLDLTHACALTLLGCGTNHPTNPSYLTWTGAAGVGIRGDSSSGLQIRNLRIQADNPACTGDLISFAYATNDSNGIVIADCFLGGSDAAQPLRSLVSMHGTSGAVIRGNMFNLGQRALRLGIDNYNIATTVDGRNMFVSQSVYSIDLAHTENLVIRDNIFEGGPDLAQHAIRARSPLNYGLCIAGNWAGDSVNPPGGILLDLQDIIGLDITGSNRLSSSDVLMRLDNIGGGKIAGNVFDSLGALYLFAGTQSSGLQIAGNYAATSQALYQGPLPTYSYLEGIDYVWDFGAKTVRIGGSTTPGIELRDGTNIGRLVFNGGQVEISNNGGGFSISPAGNVGLDMVATQKLAVLGNLGFYGYDWKIGNDVQMGWGFESSSAGGRYLVGVVHAAAAQTDPGLHGFRVRDSYLDSTNFLIDGHSAASWCLVSSTTGSRVVGRVVPEWVNSTDASRAGRLRLVAADSTGADRELIRIESDGSAGRLGFFAATAAIRQAGDVGAALMAYGLVTAPSYAAASITGTLGIANGGTGQATANAALNALLPSQTGNATKVLTTDGTNTSWATASGGGGSPGGSSGQIQYNNAGAFGGAAALAYATSGALLTATAQAHADTPLVAKAGSTTRTVSNVALTGNVATITTSAAHTFTVGQSVTISGLANSGLNGTYTIASVPISTTFTYAKTASNIASTPDSGSAVGAQTASLLQLQDAAGTARAYISGVGTGGDLTFSLKPGATRSYDFGSLDASGAIALGRSDVTNKFLIIPGASEISFSASVAATTLNFNTSNGALVFCPKNGGGVGVVQFGRRTSDSNTAVGASAEFWPITGQTIPTLCSVAPGKGTGGAAPVAYRFQVTPGGDITLGSESSTTNGRDRAKIQSAWADSADATRKGRLLLLACDASGTDREGVRVDSDGTQALISFFGGPAAARPVLSYSRSGAGETAAAAALRQALAALNLVNDSTTA
jgi:hypothetical protein